MDFHVDLSLVLIQFLIVVTNDVACLVMSFDDAQRDHSSVAANLYSKLTHCKIFKGQREIEQLLDPP